MPDGVERIKGEDEIHEKSKSSGATTTAESTSVALDVEYEDEYDSATESHNQVKQEETHRQQLTFQENAIDLWNGSPYIPHWESSRGEQSDNDKLKITLI